MNLVKEKWDEIIHKLKIEYDILDVSFKTWIMPLEVCDIKEDVVFIKVPLKAYIDIITKKYLLSLKVCIAEVIGQEYDVQLVAAEDFIEESVSESSYNNKVNKNDIIEQANLNP